MAGDTRSVEIHTIDVNNVSYLMSPWVSTPLNSLLNDLILNTMFMSRAEMVNSYEVSRQLREPGSILPPTSPEALNQIGWLVTCRSLGTGELVQFTIPAADTTLLGANSNEPDPSTNEFVDFVDSVNAAVADPLGNPVEFINMVVTGL